MAMPKLMRNDAPVGKMYRNGVPYFGGAGGSPTPSTGYVEDKLMYYYEGNEEKLSVYPFGGNDINVTGTQLSALELDPADGFTIEAYVQIDGDSVANYSRAFCAAHESSVDINIAFVNGGGSTNSDYHYNPMMRWGANIDYETNYIDGLHYGDKHTFVIVSTPDPEGISDNTITFYIDNVKFGQSFTQSRTASKYIFSLLGIENAATGTTRPLNGKLYNGRFYTRTLTAAELAANHANDITKYGGNT
jgi:hypothetical protein